MNRHSPMGIEYNLMVAKGQWVEGREKTAPIYVILICHAQLCTNAFCFTELFIKNQVIYGFKNTTIITGRINLAILSLK